MRSHLTIYNDDRVKTCSRVNKTLIATQCRSLYLPRMANSSEALITPPPNAGQVPAAWGSLSFHPVGIYDLRRRLGTLSSEPGIFTAFRDRFDYADLAWFAPGLAKSSSDSLPPYKFYSEYLILRENVPWNAQGTDLRSTLRKRLQELLFDTVRCLLVLFIFVHNFSIFLGRALRQNIWWNHSHCSC